MNSSQANQYDAIERVIYETGIRIASIRFDVPADRLHVQLSSGTILRFRLSAYDHFRRADESKLMNYELIAEGLGVHWPELDEDLSLKGFFEEELKLAIGGNTKFAMAA